MADGPKQWLRRGLPCEKDGSRGCVTGERERTTGWPRTGSCAYDDRDCTSPLGISSVSVNGAMRKRKHAETK